MQILYNAAGNRVTWSFHKLVSDVHNSLLVDCRVFQGAYITKHNENDVLLVGC